MKKFFIRWRRRITRMLVYKSLSYKKAETRRQNKRRKAYRQWLLANNKCAKCGKKENLTIDHIIPRSKGGVKHGQHNLQVLCNKCNHYKADKII